MRRTVAIVALLGIFLQTFSQALILAKFYANQDYIAKNLCENRNRPQLHCNGKCCLKKKLDKENATGTTSNSKSEKESPIVALFFTEPASFDVLPSFVSPIRQKFAGRTDRCLCPALGNIFHPPGIATV